MDYQDIANSLAEKELMSKEDLSGILKGNVSSLADLSRELVDTGKVPSDKWAQVVAEVYNLPLSQDLEVKDEELLTQIPSDLAFKRQALPVRIENGTVIVAVSDPESEQLYEDFRILTGKRVRIELAPVDLLKAAIQKNYGATVERMSADLGGEPEEAPDDRNELEIDIDHDIGDLREMAGEPTVVNLVNLVLFEAIKSHASDVHIEPFEHDLKLRYRIDGVLKEMPPPPFHLRLAITSRIKIMGGMNIAERYVPQDGHIKLSVEGRQIDLRVSCCPTVYGESIVIRILDKGSLLLDIQQLGMREDVEASFRDLIRRPHGIFLVTGPTGSGKTTTLYTALNAIYSAELKIITVEEPVEYHLPGINQIQVNVKRGLTFATGLRSIVRQDPDVIMVGEIRDGETAEIAIRAALTGHLVFSTLHTNSATGAVPRLLDMGLDPFLISSSLNGVLAQRLVRRICKECREEYQPTSEEKFLCRWQNVDETVFYRGAGCEKCGGTGYRGRVGIYELVTLNDEVRELILQRPAASQIAAALKVIPMKEDGLRKVAMGITTLEEIVRVTMED